MSLTTTQTTSSTTLKGSQDANFVPSGSTTANLCFFQPPEDGSKPHNYVDPAPGTPQRNFGDNNVQVEINDIRGRHTDFHLDKDAFQAVTGIPSAMKYEDWDSDDKITSTYYPEVEQLILDTVPGSHKVTLFDHTIRKASGATKRAPVSRVHVDQTGPAAVERVRLHNPEDAGELLKGRFRIINVWRPLVGPVQTHPLAFASAATTRDDDFVPVEHRYPNRNGQTAAVQYNQDQKFYYWSGMDVDERVFLKCWDSKEGVGRSVPHTAFVDARSPEGARNRESIEVRALVYG